jgi:MoCo/4Fe-4S cofactor protein with predicted Tat translocation signal
MADERAKDGANQGPQGAFVPLRQLMASLKPRHEDAFEHPDHPMDPNAVGHKLDVLALKEKLQGDEAPRYWRSLQELGQRPEYLELVRHEFAPQVTDPNGVSRRGFLKLMGASMAVAGLTACTRQPLEPIVPYVVQPDQVTLGKPLFFATAVLLNGVAEPVLVESHEGRPTKIEGNPQHPASLGGSSAFAQAQILQMYDPERSQTVLNAGQQRSWTEFVYQLRPALKEQAAGGGAGLRILTPSVTSPSLKAMMDAVLKLYPRAKWHQWEPVHNANVFEGAKLAFGQPVNTVYKLDKADIILSLDADFLSPTFGPGFVRYARDYGVRRKPEGGAMNRLYVVENMPSSTGAKAEHRLAARTAEVEKIARAIAAALGVAAAGTAPALDPEQQKFVSAAAKDLLAHRGRAVVIPGSVQPPAVHALAHAMNQALGAAGQTVAYTDPLEASPVNQLDSLKDLVADMNAGKVSMLVMMGVNPVYDAPADLAFAQPFQDKKVPLIIHHGTHDDETSYWAHWHIPATHTLETWSDARAHDGTVTIMQPLIAPLYEAAKSPHEMLAALTDNPEMTAHDAVKEYWRARTKGDFDGFWWRSLHDGLVADSALPERALTPRLATLPPPAELPPGIEVSFRPDPTIYDGRFANNGWLQELPKPLTRLTWDNAVMMSPAMVQQVFGVDPLKNDMWHGAEMEITLGGYKTRGGVFTVPGHADNAVTLHLGYGRSRGGSVGEEHGFSAYAVRTAALGMDFAGGATLRKTGTMWELATTQDHHNMEGRHQVRAASLDEWKKNPEFPREMEESPAPSDTLYPNFKYEGYAWGMAIDTSSCIGCNSCVVACVSENNIAVVGKEEVLRGRQMYWLRVDTYFEGSPSMPNMYFQPVPCMQCENAPCEYVCPVGATAHSTEGLNDMVYNRCIGTRYCSNNCPYKVRRFNFFLFQDWNTPQYKLMRNPEVTVRSRGVMEKCTYCVQRIVKGRIHAEEAERLVRDGEVKTACQQACPADAIVFGNINDAASGVAAAKNLPRNFGLLTELNTRPRTTYLAEVRNPNPELAQGPEHD